MNIVRHCVLVLLVHEASKPKVSGRQFGQFGAQAAQILCFHFNLTHGCQIVTCDPVDVLDRIIQLRDTRGLLS